MLTRKLSLMNERPLLYQLAGDVYDFLQTSPGAPESLLKEAMSFWARREEHFFVGEPARLRERQCYFQVEVWKAGNEHLLDRTPYLDKAMPGHTWTYYHECPVTDLVGMVKLGCFRDVDSNGSPVAHSATEDPRFVWVKAWVPNDRLARIGREEEDKELAPGMPLPPDDPPNKVYAIDEIAAAMATLVDLSATYGRVMPRDGLERHRIYWVQFLKSHRLCELHEGYPEAEQSVLLKDSWEPALRRHWQTLREYLTATLAQAAAVSSLEPAPSVNGQPSSIVAPHEPGSAPSTDAPSAGDDLLDDDALEDEDDDATADNDPSLRVPLPAEKVPSRNTSKTEIACALYDDGSKHSKVCRFNTLIAAKGIEYRRFARQQWQISLVGVSERARRLLSPRPADK